MRGRCGVGGNRAAVDPLAWRPRALARPRRGLRRHARRRCRPRRSRAQCNRRQERSNRAGCAGRSRPGGRPRALPDFRERDRRDREGRQRRGMRTVALLTREYPPDVYGGAGVHVEYLARELALVARVTVHCWGDPRASAVGGPTVVAHRPWDALAGPEPYTAALQALSIDLTMA